MQVQSTYYYNRNYNHVDSFIIIYLGMFAIGLMIWATAIIAGKRGSSKHG
jgi:hypothetical protein